MLKIDKDIPIPEPRIKYSAVIETARKLEVGDSFLVEGSYGVEGKRIYNYGRVHGKKFSLRRDPTQPNKIRVWRLA
jgi:hypothetical protein